MPGVKDFITYPDYSGNGLAKYLAQDPNAMKVCSLTTHPEFLR